MSLQIFNRATLFFSLASAIATACSSPAEEPRGNATECALNNSTRLRPDCRLEVEGRTATLYRPDGGFYRLQRDDAGWRTADGASDLQRRTGNDIFIGNDLYRLPAVEGP